MPGTCLHRFNLLIHEWLGEHGLIFFAVTVAPVADQIDNDIFLELASVLDGHPRCVAYGLSIVAVHVDHRCINGFCYICSMQRCFKTYTILHPLSTKTGKREDYVE